MTELTVSQLESYSRCPLEYHLKYRMGVPSQLLPAPETHDLPGNILGDIVHAAICRKLQQPARALNEIAQALLIERDMRSEPAAVQDITTLCDRAIAFHQSKNWLQFQTEVPFVMPLSGGSLHGTIDFIGQDAQGWHIVDYKTDHLAARSEVPERAQTYHLQMMAYAMAASRAGITPLKDITLLFLRPNESSILELSDTALTAATTQIGEIISAIAQENTTPAPTPPCRICPYHHNHMCWEDRLKKTT